MGACAAARGPEATRPRANEPTYPIILSASTERRELATAAWQALTQQQTANAAPTPELQNVTATISALPQGVTLALPKVEIASNAATTKDEATRESLRRFLTSAAPLLGVAAKDLSLIEIRDEGATKLVRYQQNPFPHPLRSNYGMIEIRITADGRVSALSSTAIPDTERLARALAAQPTKLTAQDAETRLAGRALSYGSAGNTISYTVGPGDQVKARELIVYPLPRAGDPNTLELHLAWELAVARTGTTLLVYVDAVTGDIIAAEQQAAAPTPTK
ncbi:MAG: hypothetical protein DMF64_05750 [Acidobacteria bacterium]|nr:MAG: hypothetical protein DMF64_05750 [Acidobacteriota bacterium]